MTGIVSLSRRDLLKTGLALGGGLVLGFRLPFPGASEGAKALPALFAPNAFLRIGADDVVTIVVNKSEMGQGVYTSLPMLVAEELMCDWKSVHVEPAPVDPAYNHAKYGTQVTGGSTSVRTEWERLSMAGATAREMLVSTAAETWKTDRSHCRAVNGRVLHDDGRSLAYGALAEAAAEVPVPKEVRLKARGERTLLGKRIARLDSPDKVSGKAQFGLDVSAAGMLTAVVARPPVFGGKVVRVDATRAKAFPGVKEVFRIPSGVAVVAVDFFSANKGREALDVTWDEGAGATLSTGGMREEYRRLAEKPGVVARKEGDPAQAFPRAAKRIVSEYEVPYLAHAPMEPLNCFVDLRKDSCEIRTGSQAQTWDRDAAARISGLSKEQVKLHTTLLGGGFGRRANPASDFVSEAVHVAKGANAPVKVVWTREDDMRGGFYRPMWRDRIAAGLDAAGKPVSWTHTIVGQSILGGTPFMPDPGKDWIDETSVEGAKELPYEVPNLQVDLHSTRNGVPVLWWRSVGHSHNAFVVESFLDEVAGAAGKDPLAFRLSLLPPGSRHRGVLELAAQKAGWGKPMAKGGGRGIAVHESFGSFIAHVAEVSVDADGELRVLRVVTAIDCGEVVNPGIIEAQMESGVAFGLSAALYGAITLKKGRVEQGSFDDYPVLRMHEAPRVEVHIVPSTEAPGGVGEPGVPPVAPAVANALFAAIGIRLRTLPLTGDAIRAARRQA
ncbi:MAG TPA: xanthine dehydrogenase family protein molybdopterin-binding subunit [Candidatus Deferrimicrobiaceae bacterium]|jgi:isoquinoline 1-oxidoreductase beta subunit